VGIDSVESRAQKEARGDSPGPVAVLSGDSSAKLQRLDLRAKGKQRRAKNRPSYTAREREANGLTSLKEASWSRQRPLETMPRGI
jgi:hypothetical protein